MVHFGFSRCYSDPCLYILKGRKSQEESIYVAVWVDDLIIACKNQEKLHDFKKSIARKFKMTDLGSIQHCLGMRICYNLNNQVISIDQEKYIEDLLEKFSMHNCKPVATPLIPNSTVNKEEPDIEVISNGKVQVLYKSTQEMAADCLTKNLAKDKVEKFRSILLGMPSTM